MLGCLGDRNWKWKSVPPRGTGVESVGCPWTAHLLCFGTVKTVPGLCEMDKNGPSIVCLKWYEMNGLLGVELDRLRPYINVLVQ